jgi:nitrate reductase delta subunit
MTSSRSIARALRALAALLGYPGAELRAHWPELRALLAEEQALSPTRRAELLALIDALSKADPLEVEADYVDVFDRGRATSLHLFEHVHGDSRDRGAAMIDLGTAYAKAGLLLTHDELPDYLPAALEFSSTQPPREARGFLGEIAHLLNAIRGALAARDSGYAVVFAALLELAGEKVHPVAPAREAPLDDSWAEPPAFDGCSTRGQQRAGDAQPVQIVRRPATRGQGA